MATTALVTGRTSGIGRAVANKLAELGVHVVIVGRNMNRGEKTIAEIRAAGGQADFIASDLQDALSAPQLARKVIELGNGQVDILINNAGCIPSGRPMKWARTCSIKSIHSTSRFRIFWLPNSPR